MRTDSLLYGNSLLHQRSFAENDYLYHQSLFENSESEIISSIYFFHFGLLVWRVHEHIFYKWDEML